MGNIFGSTQRSIEEEVDRILTIRRLESEIHALKEDNNVLRHLMMSYTMSHSTTTTRDIANQSEVSVGAVNLFVENLLNDPDANLSMVPDFMERALERKMILALLKAIAQAVDSAKLEFLGHEIVLQLRPHVTAGPVNENAEPNAGLNAELNELNANFEKSSVALN